MKAQILLFSLLALSSAKPLVPVITYSHVPTVFSPFHFVPIPSAKFTTVPDHFTAVPVLKDGSQTLEIPLVKSGEEPTHVFTNFPNVHSAVVPFNPVIPFSPFFTRYHAQGDDGTYTYAYSGGPSSKIETKDQFGNIQGAFNYIDPKGQIQTQQYVADSQGFRVAGTNLPMAPVVELRGPKPVEETPEVKAAREHFENEFKKRSKREADPAFITATAFKVPASTVPLPLSPLPKTPQVVPVTYSATGPSFPFSFVPSVYSAPSSFPITFKEAGSPAPVFYSAFPSQVPVTHYAAAFPNHFTSNPFYFFKPGTVTETVHNPGQAVSYRVDV